MEDRLYLENLDEYVNDANKIVTYKWLSRTLSVNVDEAKRMLFEFVTEQRTRKPPSLLNVVYMVSGLMPKNSSTGESTYLITLVLEECLDGVKQQFQTVNSEHVYSVQKTRPKNSGDLYTADYDLQKECLHEVNTWSMITCRAAMPRSDGGCSRGRRDDVENGRKAVNGITDVMGCLTGNLKRGQSRETSLNKKPTRTVSSLFERKPPRASSKKTDTQRELSSDSKEKKPKKTEESENDTAVASFFGKQTGGTKAKASRSPDSSSPTAEKCPKTEVTIEESCQLEKTGESANDKAVAPFFGKQPVRKNAGAKTSRPPESSSPTAEKRPKTEAAVEQSCQLDSPTVIPETPEANRKEQRTSPPQGERTAKRSKKQKPRRRTRQLASDSDSDDEASQPKRVPSVADSSEQSRSVVEGRSDSPPLKHLEKPKRKRIKKLKSKTYMTEEGEFVTEKVYESCSTDASDVEVTGTKEVPHQEKPAAAVSVRALHSPERKSTKGKATSNKQSKLKSFFYPK